MRYNPGVPAKTLSRRRFLGASAGLAAAVLAPRPALAARESEPPVLFVAAEHYHELPSDCYAPFVIEPREIIVHWDGNRNGRALWLAAITYQTLAYLGHSAHFAVDAFRVWQLLPMYPTQVQESYGAHGFNDVAINVELSGVDFDAPGNAPPDDQVGRAVQLVANLMEYYGIGPAGVVGHFERDLRGKKLDPGPVFMAAFRDRLARYRAARPATRRRLIVDG
jgi:N-acetyl-anhydromuramyl-L-alanine amidase AmpD